ncbi:hypothetical protein KSS87_021397 [Heliosperma pusillum]|nr:hypothetical protein KSS87_021397 [Heliosperma pusillum]
MMWPNEKIGRNNRVQKDQLFNVDALRKARRSRLPTRRKLWARSNCISHQGYQSPKESVTQSQNRSSRDSSPIRSEIAAIPHQPEGSGKQCRAGPDLVQPDPLHTLISGMRFIHDAIRSLHKDNQSLKERMTTMANQQSASNPHSTQMPTINKVSEGTDWRDNPNLPPRISENGFSINMTGLLKSLKKLGGKVRWPRKSAGDKGHEKMDQRRKCDFYDDVGHNTEDCVALRKEVKHLYGAGYLDKLLPKGIRPGGSELCGLTYSAAKRHATETKEDKPESSCRVSRVDLPAVFFDETDAQDVEEQHHDALVISLSIWNYLVKKILVDTGSSVNLLMLSTLKNMGLDEKDLTSRAVERRIDLVYGGGSVGLMGLVSQAAHDGGRHVLGVIPKSLVCKEITGETVGEVKTVSNMHQRKAEMARQADAFIALPGGYGTLEELLEVITYAQLGIHRKPVGLLNVDGYYNCLLSFIDKAVDEGFISPTSRGIIVSAPTAKELFRKLEDYVPEIDELSSKLIWEEIEKPNYVAESGVTT